jgi:transposase, IS30 family
VLDGLGGVGSIADRDGVQRDGFAQGGRASQRHSASTARRVLVAEGLLDEARRPRNKVAAKRRFLELVDSGWSARRAAREVGVNERTGRDWRDGIRKGRNTRIHPDGTVVDYTTGSRYTSAVITTQGHRAARPISERYLSLQNRLAIADGLLTGQSPTRIAAGIGKHPSTVTREIAGRSIQGLYLPHRADQSAAANRARPKASKLVTNHTLRDAVTDGLSRRYSPEQIFLPAAQGLPADESMPVSHETIYQALYFQARGGLKREVAQALRSGRTCRKPHRCPASRTHRFIDPTIMISDRPAEVADRAVPGHWEGDLIMGQANKTAIATLVERATRYTMLAHLPDGHNAEAVRDGPITTISTLLTHLRRSLTFDQGAEMAPPQTVLDGHRHGGLLLRSGQPLAAQHQREHQRPATPVLPQRHRPQPARTRRPRTRRPTTQRPPTQNARLGNPSRAPA